MTSSRLELEAFESTEELLRGYDPTTDKWNFSHNGPFWNAVGHAHAIGSRGQGQRVAIIDSGCNTTKYPRLARQIGKVRQLVAGDIDSSIQNHGTAVALLITEVAPDCVLDIYSVVDEDGVVNESAAIDAVVEAGQSDATVINLSMGEPQEIRFSNSHFDVRDPSASIEHEPCPLGSAASLTAAAGKLVFASVGNMPLHTYCPANAEGVFAVGFQEYGSVKPAPDKDIQFVAPLSTEAFESDLMLQEVPGAIGSSFASPLYAGVAAWGLTQSELRAFIQSYSDSEFPFRRNAEVDTTIGVANAPPDLLEKIERGYWRSFSSIPHSHCDLQSERFPTLPRLDPKDCPFCGVFAPLQYSNLGYWLFSTHRPKEALNVLEAARVLCPWDAKPVALEGSVYSAIGSLDRAIENYKEAVRMKPDYQPYVHALRTLEMVSADPPTIGPKLAAMTDLERTQWRRGKVRKANWSYYLVAGGLLWFHFAVPSSALARWLLVIPIILGFLRARQAFFNAGISSIQMKIPSDYPTRRAIRSLTGLVQLSAIGFAISTVALLILLFVR